MVEGGYNKQGRSA